MDRPLALVSLLENEYQQVRISSSSEDENADSVIQSQRDNQCWEIKDHGVCWQSVGCGWPSKCEIHGFKM